MRVSGKPPIKEMMDFCAKHDITCDIEMKDVSHAHDRSVTGGT
jgi:uncharacterized zinc-type alcohol dehydrogenase-like protein